MQKYFILLVIALCSSLGLSGQTQSFSGFIEAGNAALERDDYYNAFRLFEIAAQDDWKNARNYEERIPEVYYKTGISAYKSTAYEKAEQYFLRLMTTPKIVDYPLTKFYLAQSVFRQGRYDQAVVTFQAFLTEQPGAPEVFRNTAQAQIRDADWAIEQMSRDEGETQMVHLGQNINTEDSEESYVRGPAGNRYYTSNNFIWKKDSLKTKRNISRILVQRGDDEPTPLGREINLPGKNVMHTAFTPDMQSVYYSVCDYKNYDEYRCDVYRADVDDQGEWSNPRPAEINLPGYSTAQPSVGLDAASGDPYLFFASDRPGGLGGMDIYRAPIINGRVGEAENLESVNTDDDDAAPFFYSPRQTLYFATNGRFSFGGLDVYKAYASNGEFRTPVNLGMPVNSSADDAYYTRFDGPNRAYVASRRKVEDAIYYSEDRDICCYDLYEFAPDERIDLLARTFNKYDDRALAGATVALYKMTPTGPELVREITNPEGHEFNFLVEPGAKYELRASKDGFTSVLDEFDLSDPEFDGVGFIERDLYLAPAVRLDVLTFNNIDDSPLPGAEVILYEIQEGGRLARVQRLVNERENDVHFDLEIGKNYRVEGSKPGFGTDFALVDLTDYDPARGGTTLRRELYLGQELEIYVIDGVTEEPLVGSTVKLTKANGRVVGDRTNNQGNDFFYTVNLDQSFVLETSHPGYFPRRDELVFTEQDVIDGGGKLVYYVPLFSDDLEAFLPFEVYFDNDYPNPNSYRTTTDRTYPETYYPYVERKETFMAQASANYDDETAFLTRGNVDQFFEQEVEAGWEQLQRFSDALLVHLQNGRPFTLELAGFASPRAPTEYNRRLSSRRNQSIENFWRTYRDGALAPYLDDGRLTIVESALGESTANLERIYSRLDQERESIYSTKASLERRVTLRKPASSR